MRPRSPALPWRALLLGLLTVATGACASQTLCDYVACGSDDGAGTSSASAGGGGEGGAGGAGSANGGGGGGGGAGGS